MLWLLPEEKEERRESVAKVVKVSEVEREEAEEDEEVAVEVVDQESQGSQESLPNRCVMIMNNPFCWCISLHVTDGKYGVNGWPQSLSHRIIPQARFEFSCT